MSEAPWPSKPSPRDVLHKQLVGSLETEAEPISGAAIANAAALMMRGIQRELREEKRRLDDLIQEIDADIARIKKLARVTP